MSYTLEIVQQPVSKVRFRYVCEGKSHGTIQGSNSTKANKTYPTLKISGYTGPANYSVSVVSKNLDSLQHVHELSGSTNILVKDGQQFAMFSNLSIVKTPKKSIKNIIEKRLIDNYLKDQRLNEQSSHKSISQLTMTEEKELKLQAESLLRNIDVDCVRLKFGADILNAEGRVLQSLKPVISNPIFDSKPNSMLPLKIIKLDKLSSGCLGNEEIILLCEKIKKDDIAIKFYEHDRQGNLKWESLAHFQSADIHHKYAIVFKTPAYVNTNLQSPISIKIQLVRPSDQEVSNSMDFTYLPMKKNEDVIQIKRQKSENIYEFQDITTELIENNKSQQDSGILTSRGKDILSLNSSSQIQNQSINKKIVALMKQMQLCLWMYAITNDVRHLLTPFVSLMSKGNKDGDNALHLAIIHGHEEVALNVIDKVKKKNCLDSIGMVNHLDQSPLYLSLVTNQKSLFKELLNLKADWMIVDNDANNLFHLCVVNNNLDILTILLDLLNCDTGHIVNMKNSDGYTPLHLATMESNLLMVRKLVNCEYVDLKVAENRSGKIALHMAVERGDISNAACLLQQCYDSVNAQMYNGNTALHLAAAHSNLSMAAILISFGANSSVHNFETGSRNDDDYDDEDDDDDESSCDSFNSADEFYKEKSRGLQPKDFCQNNLKLLDILNHPDKLLEILKLETQQINDELEEPKIIPNSESPNLENTKKHRLVIDPLLFQSINDNKDDDIINLDDSVNISVTRSNDNNLINEAKETAGREVIACTGEPFSIIDSGLSSMTLDFQYK